MLMKLGFSRANQEEKLVLEAVSRSGETAQDIADLNENDCVDFFSHNPVEVLAKPPPNPNPNPNPNWRCS